MSAIEKLTIKNFKSIREQTLLLGPLNVFIGGNGSGKSNLIETFRFLREVLSKNVASYTALKGGADNLLHFGRKKSPELMLYLEFGEGDVMNAYRVTLLGTSENSLSTWKETVLYDEKDMFKLPDDEPVAAGLKESDLSKLKQEHNITVRNLRRDLESYRVYHFHDTSDTAAVKGTCDVEDNRFLRPQAENLAAFLYWLQEKKPDHLAVIQDTIRQIAPFFDSFRLAPSKLNEARILLEWREKGSDAYFNASSLSDGTLRFICLVTLLLQPELPAVVLLDEPELGLHPAAVVLLAELLSSAATRTQVIVATQSVTLVNQFKPEDVWTVEREGSESVFRHLQQADMATWLDDYSLGELWEKNVLGARP